MPNGTTGSLAPPRRLAARTNSVLAKFLDDRGPHLAAMVAYYALLSLVPFLFLALSLVGLLGRPSAGSYLIREMRHIMPGQSAADLVRLVESVRRNAGTIGIIGLVGMAWGSLGFYSSLESAFNIVFRVRNRAFLHQKGLTFALVLASLLALFASLLLVTAATNFFQRHSSGLVDLRAGSFAASLAFSSLASFLFLTAIYRFLTNVEISLRDVWPGALAGTVLFQLSFQALPLYLRFSDQLVALRAFGGLVILLVWLYLMANIVILGAEINWSHWARTHAAPEEELTGLA
jgi:membrane protein